MPEFNLRPIRPNDDLQVAELIRSVLIEHQCVGEGYAINDAELARMHDAYSGDRHAFFVIEDQDNRILGCGGIAPLENASDQTCELRKLYFYPELRGMGWGRRMAEYCLEKAREFGFSRCYLETVERMERAISLYRKLGFVQSDVAEGDTGHGACDTFYVKEL